MATILNRTTTFATNGTVTAAGLHNLIDDTAIYAGLITTQTELTTVGTADQILIAVGGVSDTGTPRRATVQNLFEDTLTAGTFINLNLTGALTYGTATGNRTVSTSATITTGTIPNLTAGTTTSTLATIANATITNGTITTALIPALTAGTTTGTASVFTSGTITNLSTTLAGDFTISQGTGTIGTAKVTPAKLSQPFTSGTAVVSTSGTAIDFTGIPSWVKRITLMLNEVSANGVAPYILQLGTSSGIVTTGYVSTRNTLYSSIQVAQSTSGFDLLEGTAALFHGGSVIISYLGSSNTWVVSGIIATSGAIAFTTSGYSPNLGGALDRIRLKTTDTFDAGSVNIMYEG